MATKENFLYLGGAERVNPIGPDFEFDESDIWNLSGVVCNEPKRSVFGSRAPKTNIKRNDYAINDGHGRARVTATSLPVNVPDWSKILSGEYKNRRIENEEDNGDDEDDRIPPHEYLARTRIASFSVHEGIGRTLKGRDSRRVRNAIWKQTGFED